MDVPKLRQLASDHERLEDALRTRHIPEEISWLLSLLATVLRPIDRDQIKSPSDIASYLQVSVKAHHIVNSRLGKQDVFHRVTLFLAAITRFLLKAILGTSDWSLGAIVKKREVPIPSLGCMSATRSRSA